MRSEKTTLVVAVLVLWGAPSVMSACGTPSLPGPRLAAHTSSDLVPVATPAPPAKVEIVPPRPRQVGAVWIDGEWTYRGRRARWRRGRWVVPPDGARFAPWTQVRGPDAQLYFAPSKWVDSSGNDVSAPPALVEADPSKTTVLNELGEEEDVGRDVSDDAGPPRDGGPR